jgi:hypothetical protein
MHVISEVSPPDCFKPSNKISSQCERIASAVVSSSKKADGFVDGVVTEEAERVLGLMNSVWSSRSLDERKFPQS